MLCPRCGSEMGLYVVSERSGGSVRVVWLYSCGACGERLVSEVVEVERGGGALRVRVSRPGPGRSGGERAAPRRAHRRRQSPQPPAPDRLLRDMG